MSDTRVQTLDSDQQMIRVLGELSRLAKADLSPDDFYVNFLHRVVTAANGVAGGIWLREGAGSMALRCHQNFKETGLEAGGASWDQHSRLLVQVLSSGRVGMVPPWSGQNDKSPNAPKNPTPFHLSFAPFSLSKDYFGILEVFCPAELDQEEQARIIRFVQRAGESLLEYQRSQELLKMTAKQAHWQQIENFIEQVHSSLEPRKVAYDIANDGRQLIGCDRVSVAVRRGGRTRIEAISGQDHVDRRANLVQLMAQLADSVIQAGETLHFTGETRDLPPRIERRIRDYLEESGTKALSILPLWKPGVSQEGNARPFAALVLEQIDDSTRTELLVERASAVCRHGALALISAQKHDRIFLRPILSWIGEWFGNLHGTRLAGAVLFPLILAGAIAALVFVPGELKLEGKGQLLPSVRSHIFAAEDGIVRDVFVNHGQHVEKGDLLATLENVDLAVELQQKRAERTHARNEYSIKSAQRGARAFNENEQIQLSGELFALRGRIESLDREVELLERRVARLKITAPMSGLITTWDVDRLLKDRPVSRGQLLMSEADDSQEWLLEIRMPEDRIGYVLDAHRAQDPDERLPVEFVLATQPEQTYRGWVQEIGKRTELYDTEHVVPVKIALDAKGLPPLRPSAEVRARLHCGQHAIGFVWFHEVIEFVYARILFYL